jgi:hypothetical protein
MRERKGAPKSRARQLARRCSVHLKRAFLGLFGFCILLHGSWLNGAEAVASEEKTRYQFTIGVAGDKGPAARVAVEELVVPEKRRTLLKLSKEALPVARGIAVRFEQLEAAALDELPAAVQAIAKTAHVQMQRLAFFAPGDPVPRLMAEEAVVRAPGEWILKGVLLADRPSENECRLVWNKGVARLALAKGKTLEFSDLLAARESKQ